MRADEMTPIIPTMNQLSECDFTFFETDWRTTSEYALEQVGPTTFTGKTGWISFTITFRDSDPGPSNGRKSMLPASPP